MPSKQCSIRSLVFFFISRMVVFSTVLLPCNAGYAGAVAVVIAVDAQDLCDTPSAASAQNVNITGNHRGICEYRETGRLLILYHRNYQQNELVVVMSSLLKV